MTILKQFENQIDALQGLSGSERQASLDYWHAILDEGGCENLETVRSICMLYGYLIGQGLAPSESERVKEDYRRILAG